MVEITLEKIDIIRERTGVSYTEAKEALQACEGDVVEALIFIEKNTEAKGNETINELYTTKDEFVAWIKEIVRKGNISRVKVKKDDKVIIDIPVNAGIAAGIFAAFMPSLIAIGAITAVITKVTVEITKEDGSVEVVNKIIKNTVEEVKDKVTDVAYDIKDKINNVKDSDKDDIKNTVNDENVYQYTVKFEDIEDKPEPQVEKNNDEQNNN